MHQRKDTTTSIYSPIEVEYEVYFVCHRVLDNGLHRGHLSRLIDQQDVRRQRFILNLLTQLSELRLMLLRFVFEGFLDMPHNHIDGNPILNASGDDDICMTSALNSKLNRE